MPRASVFIGNLPKLTEKDDVYRHLSIYGKITAIDILNGYGFVEFESEADALDVVSIFAKQPFLGTWARVQLAKNRRRDSIASSSHTERSVSHDTMAAKEEALARSPKHFSDRPRTRYPVIVNNMSKLTCWQELKDFGRSAGGVVAFCDIDKRSRGRGFIEYLSEEDAQRAVRELSGQDLNGNIVTVTAYTPRARTSHKARERAQSPPTVASRSAGYIREAVRRYPNTESFSHTEHRGHKMENVYDPRAPRLTNYSPYDEHPTHGLNHVHRYHPYNSRSLKQEYMPQYYAGFQDDYQYGSTSTGDHRGFRGPPQPVSWDSPDRDFHYWY
ncbi:hypothetical protein ABKN59_000375 [Abortiporus biennis]